MLADGFTTQRGRRSAHLHFDRVNDVLRGRRGARLTAITNGGAIPDQFDYDVVLLPSETSIGTLNEDFAFESMPGDVFQLGNASYRIQKVESGKVYVADAQGQPPTIPFWLGEGLGRTDELSTSVGRFNDTIADLIDEGGAARRGRMARRRELGLDAFGRRADRRVPRRGEGRARRVAEHAARDLRAVLRRDGRHASRDPLAVRLARESRLGPRAAQALLPALQLRAAGRRARGLDRDLARRGAQLRARRGRALSHEHDRARRAHASGARRADVRRVLALERDDRARGAALPQRQEGARAVPAHGRRGPAVDRVPGSARVRREPAGRRSRDPRSSARRADARRLPHERDGRRRRRAAAAAHRGGRGRGAVPRAHEPVAARARDPGRETVRVPRRRAGRGAPHARRADAPLHERRAGRGARPARPRRRSSACASKRGRRSATPDELHDALVLLGFVTAAEGERGGWAEPFARAARGRPRHDASRSRARARPGSAPSGSPSSCSRCRARSRPSGSRRSTPRRRDPDAALRELVRSRLEALGPVTAADARARRSACARSTCCPRSRRSSSRARPCAARSRAPTQPAQRRRAGRGMVRAAAARAHPSLHAEAAAQRDRARDARGLSALPAALAGARRASGAKAARRSPP